MIGFGFFFMFVLFALPVVLVVALVGKPSSNK